ncbi:uncharacterized protein RJT20DRAFT_124137 [Scheffersomyces xylosifermentans]|uniref:uncharacterized protein n=1 Tax=Scheffersomyces xylosifermentans TaxID=1304137 RepID=UPI00315D4FB2
MLNKKNIKSTTAFADVYRAADGQYSKGRRLNRNNLVQSKYHEVTVKRDKVDVVLDKDAPDYEDVVISKGSIVPPDEILEIIKPGHIKIPVKPREEFPESRQLPSSELLKVLHYYASRKFTKSKESGKRMTRSMDESALLALGVLVESWIDDIVDKDTAKMFIENYDTGKGDQEQHASNEEDSLSDSESGSNGSESERD